MSFIDRLTGRVSGLLDDVMLPDDVRTALLRAQKALAADDPAEALRLLDPIVNRKAGAARTDELRGTALHRLGRLDEAVEALRSAAAARPTPEIFLQLGGVLLAQGALEDARRAYRESLDGEPSGEVVFRARSSLAQVYVARNRPDRAVRELRKAIAVEADGAELERESAVVALTSCLVDLGRMEEAEAALAPIAGEAAAAAVEGRLLAHRGDAAAALERFEVALAQGPDPQVSLAAATSALDAGNLERADSLLSSLGAEPDVQIARGRVALARGQAASALEVLRAALERRPDDPLALSAAGWAALELGRIKDATQHFHHLLTVARSSADALEGLGACHAAAGEVGTARRQLAAAVEQGAGPGARRRLARVLIDAGDPAAAVEALTAAEVDASDTVAQATLSEAYARLATPVSLPPTTTRDPATVLRAARALLDRTGSAAHLSALRDRAQSILEALDAPLDVAILGEFNAGKSTLVNALVGEVIVPTGVLPTTAHIDVLRFGPRRAAQLHAKDGHIEEIALGDVKKRVKRDAGLIDHIEYLYPHPTLRRVNFWDTPGFNALDDDHERQAAEALERAEAIVWVLDATQALAETELHHLEQIHNASERLVVVLNKIDRLSEGDVEEVVEHVTAALESVGCAGVFPISALACMQAREASDDVALEASGFPALNAALEDRIFDRAGAIKCVEAVMSLHELAADVRAEATRRGEQLEAAADGVDQIRTRLDAEREALREQFVPTEMARLEGALELLVDIVLREVDETAQPGNRLLDTLFVRPQLDHEDLEFVLGFLESRYDDVLDRSRTRVEAQLARVDGIVGQGADALMHGQPAVNRRLISRRVRDWLDRAGAQRTLLTERVHGRYVAIARGRASAPGAERLLRDAARLEPGEERRARLHEVLPEPGGLADAIVSESEEYFAMTARFCDTLRADLIVLAIEARALATGLEMTQ